MLLYLNSNRRTLLSSDLSRIYQYQFAVAAWKWMFACGLSKQLGSVKCRRKEEKDTILLGAERHMHAMCSVPRTSQVIRLFGRYMLSILLILAAEERRR